MSKQHAVPIQTRINWLVDLAAFGGFGLMIVSGNLFLVFPSSDIGSDLHSLGSALTIAAIAIHIVLHWQWVKTMAGRCAKALLFTDNRLSTSIRLTVIVDVLIAVCFLVTMVSGFLVSNRNEASGVSAEGPFGGLGGFRGLLFDDEPRNQIVDQVAGPLFQWGALDLVHLGAVMGLCLLAALHLGMHWRWIINVTGRLFTSLAQQAGLSSQPVEAASK